MNRYRITKYDPAWRDANGAYTKADWTSIGDVGHRFDGETLTMAAYQQTEDAYVQTILAFLQAARLDALKVTDLECNESLDELAGRPFGEFAGLVPAGWSVDLGRVVNLAEIERLARLSLRGAVWCKLERPGFYVHFGHDYYLYLGTAQASPAAVAKAESLGLFVEDFVSPYQED